MEMNSSREAVSVEVKDPEVTITMPRAVAEALMAVLWNVGGIPMTSRRGLVQQIFDALQTKGVSVGPEDTADTMGSITFNPIRSAA